MIEAFTDFREGDDHSPEAADVLLRTLLDHSVVPSYQDFIEEAEETDTRGVEAGSIRRDFDANPITDAEKFELSEMEKLLNGGSRYSKADANLLWESHDDLMDLLTTYPPVILEQLLITGFVIYLLRADNVDMDSETDTFWEFYYGWGSVVRNCR